MIEMECPFCEKPSLADPAAVRAEPATFRCEACGVEVAFAPDGTGSAELAAAA